MKYTTKTIAEIRLLAVSGIPCKVIAEKTGISTDRLHKMGHRHGIKFKRAEDSWARGQRASTLSAQISAAIKLLKNNGYDVCLPKSASDAAA